ncbi:major facilitator superfamily domain-containing protein [Crepidotus variabilis]|uniref:Major facilitator superfamily domain-containing protein n=1 Tax=Crepidotus variabilis TaxID=179855 RepID=A0A9P6EM16_9AGAR|nr:major facilitator superfamily domain-containing protein [Crepidotus variabilis]
MHLSLRHIFLCLSVALNALCAGAMFTFPLISPILGRHCKLTQPQLTTVVLAGMMSQYTIAALVGWIIDNRGPHCCSLASALLFATGFGGFAWEIRSTPNDILEPVYGAFYRLTFCFFLVGLGTVFAYFSALFAASKSFPNHLGLASGASMGLFGLSPLFFSVIATSCFTDVNTGLLDVRRYTTFLGSATFIVYIAGFIFLQGVPRMVGSISHQEMQAVADDSMIVETTPLLQTSRSSSFSKPSELSVSELLRESDFWLLVLFAVLIMGMCEMVISNIGTIVASLPATSGTRQSILESSTAFQVNLIAASNTLTRISVGPLADFVSPIAAYLPTGIVFPTKHRISRFAFLAGPSLLLALTCAWMVYGVEHQGQLWLLSLGTGLSYSSVFTILPSLISSLWGMQNMGRNFGLMMYAPFIGTPTFSYLYAFVSARYTPAGIGICSGRACWEPTFAFSIVSSFVAFTISCIMWRRWKGRI